MTAKTSHKARVPQWTIPRVKDDSRILRSSLKALVIDVGGTNVKILATDKRTPRNIPSGPTMTARDMVQRSNNSLPIGPMMPSHWAIQVQYGPDGRLQSPRTWEMGRWMDEVRFREGFWLSGQSDQRCGDAGPRQYDGDRMLFLGLGTGLGSALITDGVLVLMEFAHLRYRKGRTYEEDYVGLRGLKRMPKDVHLGDNAHAFRGGFRLWEKA